MKKDSIKESCGSAVKRAIKKHEQKMHEEALKDKISMKLTGKKTAATRVQDVHDNGSPATQKRVKKKYGYLLKDRQLDEVSVSPKKVLAMKDNAQSKRAFARHIERESGMHNRGTLTLHRKASKAEAEADQAEALSRRDLKAAKEAGKEKRMFKEGRIKDFVDSTAIELGIKKPSKRSQAWGNTRGTEIKSTLAHMGMQAAGGAAYGSLFGRPGTGAAAFMAAGLATQLRGAYKNRRNTPNHLREGNTMSIDTIINSLLENDLNSMREATISVISEKAAEALEEKKQEIAASYFKGK